MPWNPFLFILLLLLIACGGGYLVARHTLGRKPALRNLIFGSIFIAAFLLLFFGITKVIPKSWGMRPIQLSIFLIAMFTCSVYFLRWFWLMKRGGKTLLNLGRLKFDKWNIYLGIGGLFLCLTSLVPILAMNEPDPVSIEGITYLPIGIVALIIGLKGSKILEKGITSSGRFMAWDKIESYGWESDKANTLTLKLKNRLPFFRTISLPILPHNKEEVDKLLTENMAKSA